MVQSYDYVPGSWKMCQDVSDQTQQNGQDSTNRTAVLLAAPIPLSPFQSQVTLVTMRERSNSAEAKGQTVILEERVDCASPSLAEGHAYITGNAAARW